MALPQPRPPLLTTPFDPHGGPNADTRPLVDFSVNSNPFGPPQDLLSHLSRTSIHTYPDPSYSALSDLLAEYHKVDHDQVVLGCGTAELIHRASGCFLPEGSSVLIASPTFGEYARAAQLWGAKVARCQPYKTTLPDVRLVTQAIKRVKPVLLWLCQPNNPTGHMWNAEQLSDIAHACSTHDTLMMIDAAYSDLCDQSTALPQEISEQYVTLYSLTKSYAVPGLRVGYTVAPPAIADALRRGAAPWLIGSHACTAAVWALRHGASFLKQSVPAWLALRQDFQKALHALGYDIQDTHTPFFLMRVAHAPTFTQNAAEAGFRVRDCSSFGLPQDIRLSTRLWADNDAFVRWLKHDD